MNDKKDRAYLSNQLCCLLPPVACKVMYYLLNWGGNKVRYYPRQFSKFMHLSVEEIELGIQTLVDNRLIIVSEVDNGWVFEANNDIVQKYFHVPMQTIHDHEGFKMAEEVTWNIDKKTREFYDRVGVMSNEELQKVINRLEETLLGRLESSCVQADAKLPYRS